MYGLLLCHILPLTYPFRCISVVQINLIAQYVKLHIKCVISKLLKKCVISKHVCYYRIFHH